jgi:hypothetical protein
MVRVKLHIPEILETGQGFSGMSLKGIAGRALLGHYSPTFTGVRALWGYIGGGVAGHARTLILSYQCVHIHNQTYSPDS